MCFRAIAVSEPLLRFPASSSCRLITPSFDMFWLENDRSIGERIRGECLYWRAGCRDTLTERFADHVRSYCFWTFFRRAVREFGCWCGRCMKWTLIPPGRCCHALGRLPHSGGDVHKLPHPPHRIPHLGCTISRDLVSRLIVFLRTLDQSFSAIARKQHRNSAPAQPLSFFC